RDALATKILAHRKAKAFAEQLRKVHGMHLGDARDLGERWRRGLMRAQVVHAPVESLMRLERSARMSLHQLATKHRNRFAESEDARAIVVMKLAPRGECCPLHVAGQHSTNQCASPQRVGSQLVPMVD